MKRNRVNLDERPAKSLVAHHATHERLRNPSFDFLKDNLQASFKHKIQKTITCMYHDQEKRKVKMETAKLKQESELNIHR